MTSTIHRASPAKHLLTGFVQCGVSGGTIVQTWNANKPAYRCWYNHSRGRAGCSSSLVVDMLLADDAVLRAVSRDLLDPDVVREALDLAVRELEQPDATAAARLEALKREFSSIEAELARFAEAIADAGPLDMKVREQRRDALRAELKTSRRTDGPSIATRRGSGRRCWSTWRTGGRWRARVSPRRAASCARCSSTGWSSRP